MAAPMEAVTKIRKKISKSERKIAKRRNKTKHTLLAHDQIDIVEVPTRNLVVANGGLGNNVEQEELLTVFSLYGSVVDIVALPDKPYAFVSFADVEAAIGAHEGVDGRLLNVPGEVRTPGLRFYTAYVEQAPSQGVMTERYPAGLIVLKDVISPECEQELLKCLNWEEQAGQPLKHRRVKHFGYEFEYGTNLVNPDRPLDQAIPEVCQPVLERIVKQAGLSFMPDQLTVNQYQPGQGIPPHIDTHSPFEDAIISLSLGSQVVMEFCHPDGDTMPVLLRPRTAIVMTGESRYLWTHGITPRKSDIVPISWLGNSQHAGSTTDSAQHAESNMSPASCSCETETQEQRQTENVNVCKSSASGSSKVRPESITMIDSSETENSCTHLSKLALSSSVDSDKHKSFEVEPEGNRDSDEKVRTDTKTSKQLNASGDNSSGSISSDGQVQSKACAGNDNNTDFPVSPDKHASLTLIRRETRTSFTFRKVRRGPCTCNYPSQCDSQKGKAIKPSSKTEEKAGLPETNEDASRLESLHVHKVYEEIAGHFSDTRHTPWPRVVNFIQDLPHGSLLGDVGCGNGKYLGVNQNIYKVGCDRSAALCDIVQGRGHQTFVCDGLKVPLKSASLDACISIAVIHHFSTEIRRLEALKELSRLLRPGGKALVYVWAFEQQRGAVKSNYLSDHRINEKKSQNSTGPDCLDPSQKLEGLENETKTSKPADQARLKVEAEIQENTNSSDNVEKDAKTQVIKDIPNEHAYGAESNSKDHNKQDQKNTNTDVNTNCEKDNRAGLEQGLTLHVNRTHFNSQDLLVPWHLKGQQAKQSQTKNAGNTPEGDEADKQVFHRYYHVFCDGELENLCKKIADVKIVESYYDKGNWCVIFEKL